MILSAYSSIQQAPAITSLHPYLWSWVQRITASSCPPHYVPYDNVFRTQHSQKSS